MADYVHPLLRNLAEKLDDDELKSIGDMVMSDFKRDEEDRDGWLKMHAKWTSMYFQQDTPINPPWEGSSAESIPILAEACNQFHARAFQAMFADPELIRVIPTGHATDDSQDRGERVATHMRWQLLSRDRSYKRNKDRLLLSTPLHGSFFTKTYYDPMKQMPVVRNVRAVDLVLPYGDGPRDIEDLDRKTEIIWISVNETRILADEGYFSEAAEVYMRRDPENPVDRESKNAHGLPHGPEKHDEEGQARLLECHRNLDLDEDGIAEPYIVTVDSQTGKVLRVAIRWLTDEAGNPIDYKRQPSRRKWPIEYYTHYVFLENPDGVYGLGLGHLLSHPNSAVNKLLRQTIDAATLATAGNLSGFVSDTIGPVPGGEVELSMGKFKKLPAAGSDIKNSIVKMEFPGPQPALVQTMELIMGRADRLATVTEAVTGQADKVMQPTTILALLEESSRIFSAVNERIIDAWVSELEKVYLLNSMFIDPVEYFTVLDGDGSIKSSEVARTDYLLDWQIMPIVDPKMSTERQRFTRAEVEWNFLAQNPLVQQNPICFYNASKRFLRAIGTERINEVLPAPDPLGNIQAALRSAGLDDQTIQVIIGQIGNIAMAANAGNPMGPGMAGTALPGSPVEDAVSLAGPPGAAGPSSGPARGPGLPM